jgi:tRNA threonylcarbamoyl adenosine modification protein YjeE
MNDKVEKYLSININDTRKIIVNLLERTNLNTVFLLSGEMGTGKTYICSQIASHFGVKNFASSSFQRVNQYAGKVNIVHCDFYRSQCDYDFFFLEVEPLLVEPWILLMEWFNLGKDVIDSEEIFEISLKHNGGSNRIIEVAQF